MRSVLLNGNALAGALTAACLLPVPHQSHAQGAPLPGPVSGPTTMSCPDGSTYQCSGGSILRTDNGVALTSSGVQAYGISTSDLANPNPNPTAATGLRIATGGLAEVRLAKDPGGVLSAPVLLLSNLGLSWDGKTERPPIIETFATTQGRTVVGQNGAVSSVALPAASDLNFFDVATKGGSGTQTNYANNRYFPRTEAVRCPAGQTCANAESAGLRFAPGDWRAGGAVIDTSSATRLHSDGDARAGAGPTAPNGSVTPFPGSDGLGIPFPGTKGYRDLATWNLDFANLATWVSQDTVQIAEWAASNEHNKNRRGAVAFGIVTDPATVPVAGTATYSGVLQGWYSPNGSTDPEPFRGAATVVVNFATRQVEVTFADTATNNAAPVPVPVALKTVVATGAPQGNVANYFTGAVDNGTLSGGVSGRYFGPVVAQGTGGNGPIEVAGAFQLSNQTTGAAAVGGFIARKP